MLSPAQLRAARGLLGWRQIDLALASGVSDGTIKNFELGKANPSRSILLALQTALEQAGVVLIDDGAPSLGGGAGVRMRQP